MVLEDMDDCCLDERVAGVNELGEGQPHDSNSVFLECDSFVCAEETRTHGSLARSIADAPGYFNQLAPAWFSLSDLATEAEKALEKEVADVMRLESVRLGSLKLVANCGNLGRVQ